MGGRRSAGFSLRPLLRLDWLRPQERKFPALTRHRRRLRNVAHRHPQAENFSCEPVRRPVELRDQLIASNLRGHLQLSANANASETGDFAIFDVMPLRLPLVARCDQIWFAALIVAKSKCC